ncbi:MAG: ABC transporter substrate-binding protein [Inquilinus sp.]|uniref:ABC transporter substrate-binding protein n=1 Tax=Inquilinus sp. TaxID=1932117 RepID=UPI003F36D683
MKTLSRRSAISLALAAPLLTAKWRPAAAAALPDYYPADYAGVIEASKAESGVLVYSNVGEMNWRLVLQQFNAQYPWIKVQTLDLSSNEVFERYYAEQATGKSTVDAVVSHSAATWLDFVDKGNAEPFQSAEDSHLPDWSRPAPNIYTVSADPYVIAYNKLLLPEAQWPKTVGDIVKLVKDNPGQFDRKIATGQPMASAASQNMMAHYVNAVGEERALEEFATLGPISDLYRSAGPIMEKITTGEYLIGYRLSGIQLFPLIADPTRASVLGWAFPADGTLMLMRHIAMAKTVKNRNSTRLLIDFILSRDGQVALASGGLMPYRTDVSLPDGPNGYTYQKIAQQIGEKNIIRTTFEPRLLRPPQELVDKVNAAYKVQG